MLMADDKKDFELAVTGSEAARSQPSDCWSVVTAADLGEGPRCADRLWCNTSYPFQGN